MLKIQSKIIFRMLVGLIQRGTKSSPHSRVSTGKILDRINRIFTRKLSVVSFETAG